MDCSLQEIPFPDTHHPMLVHTSDFHCLCDTNALRGAGVPVHEDPRFRICPGVLCNLTRVVVWAAAWQRVYYYSFTVLYHVGKALEPRTRCRDMELKCHTWAKMERPV